MDYSENMLKEAERLRNFFYDFLIGGLVVSNKLVEAMDGCESLDVVKEFRKYLALLRENCGDCGSVPPEQLGKLHAIIKEFVSDRYISPNCANPVLLAQHLLAMGMCYQGLLEDSDSFLSFLGVSDKAVFLLRLNLAGVLLSSETARFYLLSEPIRKKYIRTKKSAKTRKPKAEAAYQEVVAAYHHFSNKPGTRWNSKSFSQGLKAEYIEGYLLKEKGIKRGAPTIKKDLIRAKAEGLI